MAGGDGEAEVLQRPGTEQDLRLLAQIVSLCHFWIFFFFLIGNILHSVVLLS